MPGLFSAVFSKEKILFLCFSFALLAFPMLSFLRIKRTHSKIRFPGLLVASDHMKVINTVCFCMHHCCGSGPGIRCLLAPGSGIRDGLKSGSGSGMNHPDHISESLELIFWFKYLNSLLRIRDPGWKKFGSGMEKIRIRDYIELFIEFFLLRWRNATRKPCANSRRHWCKSSRSTPQSLIRTCGSPFAGYKQNIQKIIAKK